MIIGMKIVNFKGFSKGFLSAIFAGLVLSGCNSTQMTEYNYIPPKTHEDKVCTKECMSTKLSCESKCNIDKGICKVSDRFPGNQNQRKSSTNLINVSYSNGNLDINKLDCKSGQCFYRCNYTYNQCYQDCGGKVSIKN